MADRVGYTVLEVHHRVSWVKRDECSAALIGSRFHSSLESKIHNDPYCRTIANFSGPIAPFGGWKCRLRNGTYI